MQYTYNIDFETKFKTAKLKAGFCHYSNANSFVKEAVEITGQGTDETAISVERTGKYIAFKNCVPFIS